MREPPSTGVNKLYAEIDELHNKGNAMRKVLGQPSQPNTDIADIKKQQRPEAALLALRVQLSPALADVIAKDTDLLHHRSRRSGFE